jgi:predicted DNA-binding ribbon-helix-helix protein
VKFNRRKRAIFVAGRKTSVDIEAQFWDGLREAAIERGLFVWELVTRIDAERREPSLSSAIRVFVLGYYRDQVSARKRQIMYPTERLEVRMRGSS